MAELVSQRPVEVHGRYWSERLGKMCGRTIGGVVAVQVAEEALGVRWWDAEGRRTFGPIQWLRLCDITAIVPMDDDERPYLLVATCFDEVAHVPQKTWDELEEKLKHRP